MKRMIKPSQPETVQDLKMGTLTTRPLKNVKYTGQLMRELAIKYQNDVSMYAHLSFMEFYDKIKNIPYKEDPKKQEFLQRPYYTLMQRGKGGDCDDKSICIGAYCAIAKIPFRFVAVGKKSNGRLHHVITEVLIDNSRNNKSEWRWVHIDPTYAFNVIGQQLYIYKKRLVISEPYPEVKDKYPTSFNGKRTIL
jgi:transglutaminase-like putative cysteine protease